MTNTRITDPESLEKRYPCILHEFSIRRGSGGKGEYPGGDGCVRDIEFRRAVTVSVLSERRTVPPPGIVGGGAGSRGENIWVRHDEYGTREIMLGGRNTVDMKKGDRIVISMFFTAQFCICGTQTNARTSGSPGGGAYGKPEEPSAS